MSKIKKATASLSNVTGMDISFQIITPYTEYKSYTLSGCTVYKAIPSS